MFVPLMIGLLFFMIEFFLDQFLAFLVLSLVWFAEVFSTISLRTKQSIQHFPSVFFLYFCLFHFYFFAFPFGFSYFALFTVVLFLTHAMFCFWNYCEVPAFEAGLITALHPRYGAPDESVPSLHALYAHAHNHNGTSTRGSDSHSVANVYDVMQSSFNRSNGNGSSSRRPSLVPTSSNDDYVSAQQQTAHPRHRTRTSSSAASTESAYRSAQASPLHADRPHSSYNLSGSEETAATQTMLNSVRCPKFQRPSLRRLASNGVSSNSSSTSITHTPNVTGNLTPQHSPMSSSTSREMSCSRHEELSRRIQHQQMAAMLGLTSLSTGGGIGGRNDAMPQPLNLSGTNTNVSSPRYNIIYGGTGSSLVAEDDEQYLHSARSVTDTLPPLSYTGNNNNYNNHQQHQQQQETTGVTSLQTQLRRQLCTSHSAASSDEEEEEDEFTMTTTTTATTTVPCATDELRTRVMMNSSSSGDFTSKSLFYM